MTILGLFINVTNGQIWDSLSTNLRGEARHFKEYNGLLYVGVWDSVPGTNIFNIGTWNGSSWDTVGAGIDGIVYSSAQYHNKLFFGGYFDYVNGPWPGWPATHVYNLTSWDGNQFSDLGFDNGAASRPFALEVYQDELYIGFNLADINGTTYYGIARYNDSTYNDVNGGVTGFPREVNAMTKYNNELIVGGWFGAAGSLQTPNIARWNGSQWLPMNDGLNNGILSLFVDTVNNILYAGGSFLGSGSIAASHIAKWDGNSWSPIGNGLSDPVFSITMHNGKLFAGTADNNGLSSLWYWDGTQWHDVNPYPNGIIYNLQVYQNEIYVGGGYYEIGGIPWAGIAKYTDTTTVGVKENESDLGINLYPNPTSIELKLELNQIYPDDGQVEIIDSKGVVIFTDQLQKGITKKTIQLPSSILPGIYICRFSVAGNNLSQKFFVK